MKQFNKIITEYGIDEVFGGIVDTTTRKLIEEEFFYRYAGDEDEKFIHYFKRNLRRYKDQYLKLLDLEGLDLDPLEIKKIKRMLSGEVNVEGGITTSTSGTETRGTTKGGTITKETDNSTTQQTTGKITTDGSDSNTQTNNLTSATTDGSNSTSKSRQLFSDTPQANVASTTVGGIDNNITWTYASNLTDNSSHDTTSGNSTTNDTGTIQNAGTNESETNSQGTATVGFDGTETTTDARTENVDITNAETKTTSNDQKTTNENEENITGRDGFLLSEILEKFESYVRNNNAFDWYCKKLNKCFMIDLLYGEDA